MGQLGAAADSNGARTTPETAQQIIAAQYVNSAQAPVLAGGQVAGTATLAYHVTAGVGLVRTAAGAVYAAWADTDTALTTAPETGSATDVVYVDADGLVHVARYGDQPAGVCVLDRRTIGAATTATTSTTSTWHRPWAEPYGAGLGTLAFIRDTPTPGRQAPSTWTYDLYFTTTETRDVTYTILQALKSADTGEINPVAVRWTINVDGSDYAMFELMATRMRRVEMKETFHPGLPAGDHHVKFTYVKMWPDNAALYNFGGADGYEGMYFRVTDEGVSGG